MMKIHSRFRAQPLNRFTHVESFQPGLEVSSNGHESIQRTRFNGFKLNRRRPVYAMSSLGSYSREGVIFSMSVPTGRKLIVRVRERVFQGGGGGGNCGNTECPFLSNSHTDIGYDCRRIQSHTRSCKQHCDPARRHWSMCVRLCVSKKGILHKALLGTSPTLNSCFQPLDLISQGDYPTWLHEPNMSK